MEYKYQVWKEGSRYEGTWLDDQAHGFGKLFHADGTMNKGEWKEHKVEGCREV